MADRADPNYYRLDASSTRPVTVSTDLEHGGVVALAATQDLLWLLHEDGFLTRVDAGSGATSSSQVASGADDVAAGPDGVWVADPARSSVARVDTETGQVVSAICVGGHPTGIAIAPDDSVWVTIAAP